MNNSKLLYIAAVLVIIMSCTRQQMPTPENGGTGNSSSTAQSGNFNYHAMTKQISDYFGEVDVDTANRMIMSYLNSINYGVNTDAPRALVYDAEILRNYLNDTSKGKIRYVKFMFAHTMDYINSGHEGQKPGANENALTMVIVGYDANNNYVLTRNNKVRDNCMPCPANCPNAGTAAYNIIQ